MLRMTFSTLLETENHCFYECKTSKASIYPDSTHIMFLYWSIPFSSEWSIMIFPVKSQPAVYHVRKQRRLFPHMRRGAGVQAGQQAATSQAQSTPAREGEKVGDGNHVQLRIRTAGQLQ